jgi:hypothetical protein
LKFLLCEAVEVVEVLLSDEHGDGNS